MGDTFPSAVLGAASGVDSVLSLPSTSELDVMGMDKPLELRVAQPTVIEVTDGRGTKLLSGIAQNQAPIFLGGLLPFRVRIDHAASAEVRFRGQVIDLTASTKDNVAYIELY
jgi:cytoskeleton protein RodZ